MKRTILVSIFVSLSFITVLAQQQPAVHPESGTWIDIAPGNAGFNVRMPGKPSEKVQAVEALPGVENHLLTLETKLAAYIVSYVQFPDDVTDPAAIKELLDRGREGGIASSGGKLKGEKEIKLNDYLGREWTMELPGGLSALARAYWVKRRLYQTVFITSPNANDSVEVTTLRQDVGTKFLNSFTLSGDVNK
ncbi:MAG TPA: hypothetical protein VF899_14610 [Pyrinomonadaceae bacterium]